MKNLILSSSRIKNKRVFEKVSKNIKNLIFRGVLKPGDRLPSEKELGNQFGVGRQTIREALRILEISGFIIVQRGGNGGPIVKDTILNAISSMFLDALQMERITIEEISVARLEIERMILKAVINNADESDIRSLQKNVINARKKIERKIMATEENVEFHKLLGKASKNHLFFLIIGSIMLLFVDLRSHLPLDLERSRNALRYNEAILNAIVERNLDKALKSLEELVRKTYSFYERTWEPKVDSGPSSINLNNNGSSD